MLGGHAAGGNGTDSAVMAGEPLGIGLEPIREVFWGRHPGIQGSETVAVRRPERADPAEHGRVCLRQPLTCQAPDEVKPSCST